MAEHTPTMQPRSSGVSRRTIVKGAAWAVPVTAVVGAAPAFAASRLPGPGELVGSVLYTKTCAIDDPTVPGFLEINGRLPGAQLYVTAENGLGGPPIVDVTIFLNAGDYVFTQPGGADRWAPLVRDSSFDRPGDRPTAQFAYRTSYSRDPDDWTFDAGLLRWIPEGRPFFRTDYGLGCRAIITYVDRIVNLNGIEKIVSRGPENF